MATKKTAKKAGGERRELIDTGTDKRYVKRRRDGTFKESDDVGKSLAADRRRRAKTTVKRGFGDQGDQPKRKSAKKR
ncbi:MAG: hypothetical protein AABN95_21830 [Acidobacteriota bacterium]